LAFELQNTIIEGKFDLGYIIKLPDGSKAELRLLEMKGNTLKHHIENNEEALFGTTVSVDIISKSGNLIAVSQFTKQERDEKKEIDKKKAEARKTCKVGEEYIVQVSKEYEWGYVCDQVNGFIEGAVKKPSVNLKVGESINVVVIELTSFGNPVFSIVSKTKRSS
jgi:hypothetical protein